MSNQDLRFEIRDGVAVITLDRPEQLPSSLLPPDLGTDCYPPDLETMVEGLDVVGQIDKQVRLLRRIPVDPMTGETEWGLRSFQDEFDADSWGGENVYDVYSLSEGVGMNGVPYAEW